MRTAYGHIVSDKTPEESTLTGVTDPLELAQTYAAELMERPHALAVWLTGSHARGDAEPYSDVDLGVVATKAGVWARITG